MCSSLFLHISQTSKSDLKSYFVGASKLNGVLYHLQQRFVLSLRRPLSIHAIHRQRGRSQTNSKTPRVGATWDGPSILRLSVTHDSQSCLLHELGRLSELRWIPQHFADLFKVLLNYGSNLFLVLEIPNLTFTFMATIKMQIYLIDFLSTVPCHPI